MPYSPINVDRVAELKQLLGPENIHTDLEIREEHGHDYTEDFQFTPDVVVTPGNTEEVSLLMKWCNAHHIPIVPRGAGTGLSGGALPIEKGVCLSMKRFNKIIEIDTRNLQATVEPGVINQVFQEAVQEENLFYPPDPASKGSCSLGGNWAENAGGPKAVKYGVTNEYLLNMEVVLPDGSIIWTGANVLKNATGYNLTQLIAGSEGTLGIITKGVVKLRPLPKETKLILVPFNSAEDACAAVSAVFRAGVVPSAMEFMERDAIQFTLDVLDDAPNLLKDGEEAHLLIEVDGNDPDVLFRELEQIVSVVEEFGSGEIRFAESNAEKERLWHIRRKVGEAVKAHSVYKEEDTVVPRAELPKLLKGIKDIGKHYGFKSVCYGHAGDGNLHVNILRGHLSDKQWLQEIPLAISEIFMLCFSLGGTISGEHGIGLVQKEYMDIVFDEANLALQRNIKDLFDPNGILNPGKIFP
jgi:glycolate oxidase